MSAANNVGAQPRNGFEAFAQMPSPGDLPLARNVRPGSTQKPSTTMDERSIHGHHTAPGMNANAPRFARARFVGERKLGIGRHREIDRAAEDGGLAVLRRDRGQRRQKRNGTVCRA